MPLDLSSLNYNLPALYNLEKSDSNEGLVANFSGTHIYVTSRGWGRFWRVLYAILELFVTDSLRLKKLKQALTKTHQVFQEQMKVVIDYVKKFQTYLEERIEGYGPNYRSIPETEYYAIGHVISHWNDTTLPYIQLMRRNKTGKINDLFQESLGETSDVASLFQTAELTKKCIHFQRILNLEYEIDGRIPLEALARLSTGKSVSMEQKKEIRNFVKKVNANVDKVGIRLFHRAMRYFLMYVSDRPKYEKHVIRMEDDLTKEEYGACTAIVKTDPDHVEWRQNLKAGDTITAELKHNGKRTFHLGEQIGKKEDDPDNNVFFAIKGEPDLVFWSSINESILGHKHWGRSIYKGKFKGNLDTLWPVEFHDIEKAGKFALMERVHTPLDKMKWSSTSPDVASWTDIQQCSGVISMIRNFIDTGCTPYPLSPKYLMLDSQNRVRSTKILYTEGKNPFNHCALEDFVIAYANNNLAIFRHVMKQSKLSEHHYSKYYAAVVNNTIEGKPINPEQLSTYRNITDHRIVDRGQELHKAVLIMRAEVCTRLQSECGHKKNPNTEKLVGQCLLDTYKSFNCGSILWPTLGDYVYSEVCRQLKLTPKVK